jgi:maltose/maltodextrin transport system substrate-binding protein
MTKSLLVLSALCLIRVTLFGWTDGELLLWLDADRGRGLQPIAKKFEHVSGIKVTIETPELLTNNFPVAAQAGKGPDIVIWAHDKVGEWAGSGLISPVERSADFMSKFSPKAWEAVMHEGRAWGYPIGVETVGLLYNRKLLDGPPPAQLSDLVHIDPQIKRNHPQVITILWDCQSPYYSWGFLASAGGYIYAKSKTGYDLNDIGVATPGAVRGLSKIVELVHAGILPKGVPYSTTEDLMSQGKAAMIISGPWAWPNLMKSGIDFAVAPIPGVDGNPGRPFVGVTVAYLNRSSANQDLADEFLMRYVLTEEGLTALGHWKPIGLPALISLENKMTRDNALLQQLKSCVEGGEIMPNIPQMGRFFSSVGAALQIATHGRASPEAALREAEANMRR